MEIPRRNGLKSLRLDKSTNSPKLIRESRRIKEPSLSGCTSKDSSGMVIIGTTPPDWQQSPASALKLGRRNPAPDKTKRVTVPKLMTWESWPSMCYSVQNALLTRSNTSACSLTWVSTR